MRLCFFTRKMDSRKKKPQRSLIRYLTEEEPCMYRIESIEKKKRKKNPPLLFNLAELQNECAKTV